VVTELVKKHKKFHTIAEIQKMKNIKNILNYLSGKLTDRERYNLEKEMNKDPFLDDAIDGFSLLSPDVLQKDLKLLDNKLKKRLNKRNPLPLLLLKIAASIVIIVAISVIIKMSTNKTPFQNLSYNKVDTIENTVFEKQILPVSEKADSKKTKHQPTNKKQDNKKDTQTKSHQSVNITERKKTEEKKQNNNTQTNITKNIKPQDKSSKKMMITAAPPQTTQKKRSNYSNLDTVTDKISEPYDQEMLMGLASAPASIQKQNRINIEILYKENYKNHTTPKSGIKKLENYINSNINVDTLKKSVNVKYSLTVDNKGNLYYFKLKSEENVINKEISRIITESFPWQPASNKGKNVREKVILKITINADD